MIISDYQRDFQCHFVKMANTATIPTKYQLIMGHNTTTNRSVTTWRLIIEQVSIYLHFIILVICYMVNFAKIMVCNWYFGQKIQKLNNDICRFYLHLHHIRLYHLQQLYQHLLLYQHILLLYQHLLLCQHLLYQHLLYQHLLLYLSYIVIKLWFVIHGILYLSNHPNFSS